MRIRLKNPPRYLGGYHLRAFLNSLRRTRAGDSVICVRDLRTRQASSWRKTAFCSRFLAASGTGFPLLCRVNDPQLLAAYLQGDECALEGLIARPTPAGPRCSRSRLDYRRRTGRGRRDRQRLKLSPKAASLSFALSNSFTNHVLAQLDLRTKKEANSASI
jgi:hypothetical protein